MNNEIKQIINKYQYDQKIKEYSNKHYFKDNSIYSRVQNNNDVERAYNGIKNSIKTYSEIYPLVKDDITQLEKYCGQYEIAVTKVIHCFDNPNCNFIYTAEELQKLIDSIFIFYKKIADISFRKACQD